jgi:hypothetical protein
MTSSMMKVYIMPLPIAVVRRYLIIALTAGLLLAGGSLAASGDEASQQPSAMPEAQPPPSLADVVYLAGALTQRLETLATRLDTVAGLPALQARLELANKRADQLSTRFDAVNAEDLQSYQQLAALKGEVRAEFESLTQAVEDQAEEIRRVEGWRQTWMAEKEKWQQWRTLLQADLALVSVAEAFQRADMNIDQALDLIAQKLGPMLALQQQAGDITTRINGLISRADSSMASQRGGTWRGGTPMIFSTAYLHQLIDLLHEPGKIIKVLSFPDPVFLKRKSG